MTPRQPNLSIGDKLEAEPYNVRRRVLELMDELSRPMSRAEIEEALRPTGMTRSERRRVAQALKLIDIVAIAPSTLKRAAHWPPLPDAKRLPN